MDVPEPDQSPFTAVTAQTSKLTRVGFVAVIMRGLRRRMAVSISHSEVQYSQ